MEQKDWKRIKEIFQETIEVPPEEREAFLEKVCEGDTEILTHVREMIAADSRAESFLDPREAPSLLQEAAGEGLAGSRLGSYLLKSIISSGGMGTVYEALQEQPHRTVAIKVMHAGLVSKSALRRFEYESQVLARLRHPNIAQVIEAGTRQEGGLPYFVMEFIPEARSITEHVKAHDLAMRERLRLFIQVCQAVHHGHQKGVIHRDLKPTNILVDAQGQVKVIDFGVARATDGDQGMTTAHTEAGQLIGTLPYMSPEQCKADPDDLDIRSDVYALGVVLYEMLCNDLPYDVRKAALLEAARVIQEEPPKRPSTTNRSLRGDVETILLKTLEKDRALRYQTVADLGADLERFLRGEIILAKPAGPATRIWKQVKRNPVLSGTTGVALLSILAFFLYVVLWSYPQIKSERNRAQVEANRAEAINAFLTKMLLSPSPGREGKEVRVVELLDGAAHRVGEAFAGQPEVEAAVRNTLGVAYFKLGQFEAADLQLAPALELYEQCYGRDDLRTVNAMHNLGNLFDEQNRLSEGEGLLREVIEVRSRVLGEEHEDTLEAWASLGQVLCNKQDFAQAESIHRRVLESSRRVLGETHTGTLASMVNLANVLRPLGKLEEAESYYREVIDISARRRGADDMKTLVAMNNLAEILLSQGRLAEAEPLLRNVLETCRRIMGEDHPKAMVTMSNLAGVLMYQEKFAEAEGIFRDVLELRRAKLGEDHPATLNTMNSLAGVLQNSDRLAEAVVIYGQLMTQVRNSLPQKHVERARFSSNSGMCLLDLGRFEEAEIDLLDSHEGYRATLGEGHEESLEAIDFLIDLYKAWGRKDKAAEYQALLRKLR